MKFKLSKTYEYWWPVTVSAPDPKRPGKFIDQKLEVLFEPLPQDEALAALEEVTALTTSREINDHGVRSMLRVVKDWRGVDGEDGQPVPFSTEMLELALQHAWFRTAIQAALRDSQNGEVPRRGN